MENLKVIVKFCAIVGAIVSGWIPGLFAAAAIQEQLGLAEGGHGFLMFLIVAIVWGLCVAVTPRIVDRIWAMAGGQ